MAYSHQPQAGTSRLSISSDTTIGSRYRVAQSAAGGPDGEPVIRTPVANGTPHVGGERRRGMYGISTVVTDENAPASLLPTSFSSLSQNPYLPSSLSTLSTTFTNPGALPKSSVSGGKSVAQRRSVAPPIVVSPLRPVLGTEFEEYLREVGPELERWEKERRLGKEGEPDMTEGEAEVGLGIGGVGGDGESKRKLRQEEELPPLDAVPNIFFDTNFNLSNPRTFDLVTERIQLDPTASPPQTSSRTSTSNDEPAPSPEPIPGLGPLTLADLATDQILQEKLSHYTAVVESHLVKEIGLRSSSFFSALSNLQSLHQQGEDCLVKIGELKDALSSDQNGVGGSAKRGLGILRGQIRRRGLERLEEGVRKVEEVWAGVEGVKELVEDGEWMGALEVAEDVEEMYHGSSATASTAGKKPRLNLTRIKALSSVPKKLSLLRSQIAKSLEGELIAVLEHEMERAVTSYISLSATPNGWKHSAAESVPTTFTAAALSPTREESGFNEGGPQVEGEAGADEARERATDRVRPVVRGLVRADGMEGAVAAWREAVLRDVRSMVREHLPTSETPTVEEEDAFAQVGRQSVDLGSVSEKSVTLAKKLRAMSHSSFLALARDTYLGLLGCIEVIDLHSKVLIALATEIKETEKTRKGKSITNGEVTSPEEGSNGLLAVPGAEAPSRPSLSLSTSSLDSTSGNNFDLPSEISDVVHASAELANLRFSKVIGVRTEVHSQLPLADFVEIFDVSWAFVVQCEVICQRMIVGLRGVMVGQAKTFLQTFHQKRLTESAKLVENEQWAACDVGPETQKIVGLIIQCAVGDPTELLIGRRKIARAATPSAPSTPAPSSPPVEDSATPATTGEDKAKQLDIEGREYYAVSAGLACVDVLIDYLQVVINCPLLTTDAMSKVVEFMKSFNSRTCQVVLGAGAMRSAGLKNITAKHLALASQALSIMISLIPYIRETLRRHLNPKQAVMLIEFDKLKRDYQEHQNEIHSKLVAIMSDRLQVHCKTLEGVDWEVPQPANRKAGAPNSYMEALVKEHTTLHKVLSRFLLAPTVEFIMMQVFSALNSRLAEELGKIEIKSEDARARMLNDVTYLKIKLGELKGMERGTPGAELENLVRSKKTPAPPLGPARRKSSTSNLPTIPPASPGTPPPPAPETPPPATRSTASPGPFSPPSQTPPPPTSAPASAPSSPTPSATPPPPEPVRRKSMAERLAEIAKRKTPLASASVPPPVSAVVEIAPPVPERETIVAQESDKEKEALPSVPAENVLPPETAAGTEDVQEVALNGEASPYGASPYTPVSNSNLPPIPPATPHHTYSTTYSPTTYSPIAVFPSTPPPRINVDVDRDADSTPKAEGRSSFSEYQPESSDIHEEPSPDTSYEEPQEEAGEAEDGGNGYGMSTGETSFGYETPAYLTTIGEESETESTENETEEEEEAELGGKDDDANYAELDEEEGSFV